MYVGQAVKVQTRVATGHAGLRSAGKGIREHIPVPTTLKTFDAIVIAESAVPESEPKLTLVYKKDDSPLNFIDIGTAFAVAYDVPHKEHEAAEGEIFWYRPNGVGEFAAALELLADRQCASTSVEGPVVSVLPSAADLDAVAKEEKAKEATGGEVRQIDESHGTLGAGASPRPRIVKGSKAAK